MPPVTVAVKTSSRRVPAVTGIDSPVVIPLEIVPIATAPVRGGASTTEAPAIGAKTLFGVGELYIWAVIVTVLPTRDASAATL